jgi:hypothetical protein
MGRGASAAKRIAQAAAHETEMKLQVQLFALALVLSAPARGIGGASAEDRRQHFRLMQAQGFSQRALNPLDRAYVDAFYALGQPNACSEFFGGEAARRVLTELLINLRATRMNDSRIGVRMSGPFTVFANTENEPSYRLFAEAELNTAGPFYRAKVFDAEPFVPGVGSYQPNTREARALILLHELAHLIQGQNHTWLIPDDGDSPQLSRLNTATVESKCGKQIQALQAVAK